MPEYIPLDFETTIREAITPSTTVISVTDLSRLRLPSGDECYGVLDDGANPAVREAVRIISEDANRGEITVQRGALNSGVYPFAAGAQIRGVTTEQGIKNLIAEEGGGGSADADRKIAAEAAARAAGDNAITDRLNNPPARDRDNYKAAAEQVVEVWAHDDNTDLIPLSKIPNIDAAHLPVGLRPQQGQSVTDGHIRTLTEQQFDAADTTKNKSTQLGFLKKGSKIFLDPSVNDRIAELEAAGHASSTSSGNVTFLENNVDLNTIVNPGLYANLGVFYSGANNPSKAGSFLLLVENIEGVASSHDGICQQLLISGEDVYFRTTPANNGTTLTIPTSVTEPWKFVERIPTIDDFSSILVRESRTGRNDDPVLLKSVGAGIHRAQPGLPLITVDYYDDTAIRPEVRRTLLATFATSYLHGKTLQSVFINDVESAQAPTTDGAYTRIRVTAGTLNTNDVIRLNFKFTDGTYLYEKQTRHAYVTKEILKNLIGGGIFKGFGELPNVNSYSDGDLWMGPNADVYRVTEAGGNSGHLQVPWAAPLVGAFRGFVGDHAEVARITGFPVTADQGTRPTGVPTSLIGLFEYQNKIYFVATENLFGFDVNIGVQETATDWDSTGCERQGNLNLWVGSGINFSNNQNIEIIDSAASFRNPSKQWTLLTSDNDVPLATADHNGLMSADQFSLLHLLDVIKDRVPSQMQLDKLDGIDADNLLTDTEKARVAGSVTFTQAEKTKLDSGRFPISQLPVVVLSETEFTNLAQKDSGTIYLTHAD